MIKEIKKAAKEKVKGNKWNLIWPILVISVVFGIIDSIFQSFTGVNTTEMINAVIAGEDVEINYPLWYTIISSILGIIEAIFAIGYVKYVLNIVRGEKAEFSDIIDWVKNNWLRALLSTLLVVVIILGASFVIGIAVGFLENFDSTIAKILVLIAAAIGYVAIFAIALGFVLYRYILVDTEDKETDVIKSSWNLMKGHKGNYFLFCLSFIGWIILTVFTFGILLIWLFPFITIAEAMYYEKIKELNQK